MIEDLLFLVLFLVLAYVMYKKVYEGFLPNYSTAMRFSQSLGEVGRAPTYWQTDGTAEAENDWGKSKENFNDPQLGNLMHTLYTN